jgi:predicted peptidase
MAEMISRRTFCFGLGAAAFLRRASIRVSDPEVFTAESYRNSHDQTMPYRLFVPPTYDKRTQYPLVLWLSGGDGRGSNNLNQISFSNVLGSHAWTTPENQARHPCFVMAPQCPDDQEWLEAKDPAITDRVARAAGARPAAASLLALEILRDLQKRFRIDARRLYITGQSMGGSGTWSLIQAYPKMFAAAIPLCGAGDPAQAANLTKMPIWAFHGAQDPTVGVEGSRNMIDAIRKAGGNPRYSEYPDTRHNVFTKAFTEPELLPWVFSQSRHS